MKNLSKNYLKLTIDTITKLIIPMIVLLVIIITAISLVQLYFYQEIITELGETLVFLTIGIIAIITTFSVIIIMLNKNLSRFVNMKTKELQEKQNDVNQQLNQLKKIGEEKSEFLSMITHELKTPIVPIKTYTELLLLNKHDLDEEQIKKLRVIQSSTTVLLRIISDLLDIQKIELKQLHLKKEKYNIADLINEAIEKNQPIMQKNKITLEKDLNDVYCKCDKVRIEQVLNNLITNAIKFTKNNINIKLDSHAGIATIRIKDNGIGLDTDKFEKIFTKIYQTDIFLPRKHQARGLGLAICKGIIDAHNGEIWVESKGKNTGSEFYFQLPLD